jgi:choline dehydrogenase-like flavoprotein
VGKFLRAHPGAPVDVLLPGEDWGTDRGYQWNIHHHAMDKNGDPTDAVVHASAGFAAATPWVAATFKVGLFGKPYKDIMRQFRHRAGAFVFAMKPNVHGRVTGTRANAVIDYPIATTTGVLEDKTINDLIAGIRVINEVYRKLGSYAGFPNSDDPDPILKQQVSLFVTTSGALHPQGTCRAGADPKNSVVDTNGMSWDIKNLMCCDASVIPHHISSNPNSLIMAIGSRGADFVNREILGARTAVSAEQEMEEAARQSQEAAKQ